jgi:hypothetical protein
MGSVPLYVVYKLDSINYKIEYGINYKPVEKKEKPIISIDKNLFYIVFVQKKENKIVLNLFDNKLELKKYKCKNYENMLEYLKSINCIIVLKNVKKELAYLSEYEPEIYEYIKVKKIYCFDNFLKYSLCLPLFIQGKISKRYRIPTIDEYIQKKEISNITSYKSEYTKQRLLFQELIPVLLLQIDEYNKNMPNTLDWSKLQSFIDYLICTGIETHNICYIANNLANKRNVEKSVEFNIVFIVIEQYIRNPKTYDFFILESDFKIIQDKFILISQAPFQ